MDGIGLDTMMSAEQVEKMFGNQTQEETTPEDAGGETPEEKPHNETTETAEVDFSDLLGNQPESVGSEKNTEGNGDSPESKNDPGTPQTNLFSSIAKALRDEGVFPDLSDDTLKDIKDAKGLKKMFDDEISKSLDERQKRIESALNSGATSEEMQGYQQAMNYSQFLEKKETYDALLKEGADGEKLRKQVMYQDYVNRGFSHERAVKLVEKSIADGTDIDDAKDALNSCKDYYKQQIEDFQQEMEDRKKELEANEQKQFSNLKKNILDKEDFFGGVKVDKQIRQKAYDSITKPVYKDEQGNFMNALQKYQRENPMEFMGNVALLFALTDGFKSVENLTKGKVKDGLKKGFAELESVLNSTSRRGDGTLNLANTAPDDAEREKWDLAI